MLQLMTQQVYSYLVFSGTMPLQEYYRLIQKLVAIQLATLKLTILYFTSTLHVLQFQSHHAGRQLYIQLQLASYILHITLDDVITPCIYFTCRCTVELEVRGIVRLRGVWTLTIPIQLQSKPGDSYVIEAYQDSTRRPHAAIVPSSTLQLQAQPLVYMHPPVPNW